VITDDLIRLSACRLLWDVEQDFFAKTTGDQPRNGYHPVGVWIADARSRSTIMGRRVEIAVHIGSRDLRTARQTIETSPNRPTDIRHRRSCTPSASCTRQAPSNSVGRRARPRGDLTCRASGQIVGDGDPCGHIYCSLRNHAKGDRQQRTIMRTGVLGTQSRNTPFAS